MSGSKHLEKIAWSVTVLMLVITIMFMSGEKLGLGYITHTMGYEKRLFDSTKVHNIDIVMSDWDKFIENAKSEQYYTANVVIDGEAYKNIGIRGKGNTSISTVSSLGSSRYSFKIEFDRYEKAISYHGLDKLSLNNLIQDSTMMKDYLTYTMMREFGATTPICSFAHITVNGKEWGLYLAVEGLEDGFLERNYGSDYGELYKPDSMNFGGGRGNGKEFNMDDFGADSSRTDDRDRTEQNTEEPQIPDTSNFDASKMPDFFNLSLNEKKLRSAFEKLGLDEALLNELDFDNISIESIQSALSSQDKETVRKLIQELMVDSSPEDGFNFGGMGGFGMGSSDVKLKYTDDSLDSYSNIWEGAKTAITESDKVRMIESLRKLSNGEQIESVVDVEKVIRYFVVHNYVCNGDSYTGSMIHNYYLYEEDGQLTMLPWDYNLAYGTFSGGNGQSTVNTPIDAPVRGGGGEDRPMWSWILSNETYTEMYHRYFEDFLDTVDIDSIIDDAYNLIKSYVKNDPTSFYTYEEFETGVETMRQFCTMRTESISMQLENGETSRDMNYVDASTLNLSDMGTMGGKDGFGVREQGEKGVSRSSSSENTGFDRSGFTMPDAEKKAATDSDIKETSTSGMNVILTSSTAADVPEGFDPSQLPEGFDSSQMPENFDPSQLPEDFDPSQMPEGFDPS